MLAHDFYTFSGLFSFCLTWFAIFYVLYKNPREFDKSISHHAAKNVKVYRLFAIIMSFALLFLATYSLLYLAPTLKLDIFIIGLLMTAITIELLTTWIPLTEDRKYHPHAILSNAAAFLMPFITIGLIMSRHLSIDMLSVAYISLVTMIVLLIIFFAVPKARNKYLIYQSIYIVAFQLAIVLVPFLA